MIACVTRNEEIIFCHVPSRTILERTSIRHHQVVSHDLFSCALQSLPISPCNTYRHSVSVFKGRLLCLGVKDVMIASPIPWNDRLKLLMESKRFNTALLMALSMYDETPTHVTVGLPSDPVERKRVLALFINDGILKQLLDAFGEDASQSEFTPENLELLEVTTRTLFSSCITIGRLDTLFGQVFERFAQANLTDTFMETLEPLVLDGSITDIESPLVMHALTRRLESTNQLSRLQSIILKLDVSTLDIDAILQVTGKHFLFSALIHVYNQAFHDYVTPIAEMIRLLSGRDDETMSAELLSTLFAYLSATLSGKSFPSGVPLPEDIASKVIRDSFGFLFSASDCTWQGQQVLDTDQHYPYLTFMVIRDPQSFITLIDGLLNDSNLRRGKASTNNSTIHPHQESELFIDEKFILTTLQHLVEQNTSSREMIQLKCFIARSFARLRGSMTLEHGTLEKLVQSLVALVDEDSRQERQNAVMDLIRAGAAFDESLRRYEEAAFWQVYELLARSQMRLNLIVKVCDFLLLSSRVLIIAILVVFERPGTKIGGL